MNQITEVNIYEPDNPLKRGYFYLVREILQEMYTNRWLTYQLFRRDFLANYKQSVVGIFWALLLPIFSVGTFFVLNRSGILNTGDMHIPYPIYALTGLSFWQIVNIGLLNSANSMTGASRMVSKIKFSKKSLVLSAIGQAIIPFMIQSVLVIVLFSLYAILPSLYMALLPILAIPLILLTLGLGFILALLNALMRDASNVLPAVLSLIMFATPILYIIPSQGLLNSFNHYNIFYYLITLPRDMILTGQSNLWMGYIISSVIALIVFFVGAIIFHISETRMAERV